MTTADLLTASRASHDAYRQLAKKGKKPIGWQSHVWDAQSLRDQAHALDPTHADPAWQDDKVPHAELVDFYEKQLGLRA